MLSYDRIISLLDEEVTRIVNDETSSQIAMVTWPKFTKLIPSKSRKKLITFAMASSHLIERGPDGGSVEYSSVEQASTELEAKVYNDALKLPFSAFSDMDGVGIDLAREWTTQVAAEFVLLPEKKISSLLRDGDGGSITTFDGANFFSTAHPVNVKKLGYGYFANLFTSTPSGTYPGAVPIDESKSAMEALQNLAKVFAYIAGIKHYNGETLRGLRPEFILAPPRLMPRVCQLVGAEALADVSGSGSAQGGTSDVRAYIKQLGLAQPVQGDYLGASFTGGSDTTYYVIARQNATSALGSVLYSEREPFSIRFFSNQDQIELARSRSVEWLAEGRISYGPGLPWLIFKCKAS